MSSKTRDNIRKKDDDFEVVDDNPRHSAIDSERTQQIAVDQEDTNFGIE
jgi:hypothetical protein